MFNGDGGHDTMFNGDGDDVTLNGSNGYDQTYEIRSAEFDLPSLLNIGGSYDFLFSTDHRLTVSGNFTSNSFSKDQILFGTEYGYKTFLMLRMGYSYEKGIFNDFDNGRTTAFTGFSTGFSFEIPVSENGSSFGLDYSFRPASPLSSVHTIGARIDL